MPLISKMGFELATEERYSQGRKMNGSSEANKLRKRVTYKINT